MDFDLNRLFLDSTPTVPAIPEKVAAFVLGRSLSTLRGWRHAHKPRRFDPPPCVTLPNGRIVYPTPDLLAFVVRTGIVNRSLAQNHNNPTHAHAPKENLQHESPI